jgi:hypothetical protein
MHRSFPFVRRTLSLPFPLFPYITFARVVDLHLSMVLENISIGGIDTLPNQFNLLYK